MWYEMGRSRSPIHRPHVSGGTLLPATTHNPLTAEQLTQMKRDLAEMRVRSDEMVALGGGWELRNIREHDGIRLHSGFKVVRAANGRLTIKGEAEARQLEYDKILVGIGRKANVEDLGP